MLTAPRTPSQNYSGTGSVIKAFVRLHDVKGGVACLNQGGKALLYRGILKINTVNFALMSEEDQDALIEGFKGFLNGISFPLQILIRNLPYRLDDYLNALENYEGDLAEVTRDHAEFVRQFGAKRALVKRAFYIIFPADQPIAIRDRMEALINAQTQIKLRGEELLRQLERMGLSGHRLTDNEIISLYQSCFLTDEARAFPLTDRLIGGANSLLKSSREPALSLRPEELEALLQQDGSEEENTAASRALTKKDEKKVKKAKENAKGSLFISLPELIAPSSMQIFPWYMRIDGEASQEFVRTLVFVSYPRSAYPGWLDSIIQIDEPYVDFSVHIEPLEPQAVTSRLGRKAIEFRGSVLASRRQGKVPDPTTAAALQDVEVLRERIARGEEHIFNISTFVQVRGRTRKELGERNNRLVSAIRSLDFRALPAHWQHHAGFLSCLPSADNQLGRGHLFGTGSASTFYPFTGSDLSMDTGVMFGVHPNGGLIILNPFKSDELENANLVVFAKSGAGKSFFLKIVSCRLLPTCNVYVIDPEAEYNHLCERVGGQYVRLSSDSLQINPFELYGRPVDGTSDPDLEQSGDEGNFFREKLLNLTTLFELLLSDDGTLTQREKAFLYKCLVKTYENRGITMDTKTHVRPAPNMQEFYVIMSSTSRGDRRFGVGEDLYGLSERLERYLHLFPPRTRVMLDNRFIDFNIRELNDTLKPIGLFLITEFLWTRMRQARRSAVLERNTIILIDEAWLLMQFSQGAKFLAEFARRIRKYGGGLWCTTQNSDDFLSSEEGRTILAMATMKFLMKQDTTTIDSVIHSFRLSPGQKNFLLSARRGEGLFGTRSWTSMEVVASPKEAEMANTTLSVVATQSQQEQVIDELVEDLERLAEIDSVIDNKQPIGKKSVNGVLSSQAFKSPFDDLRPRQ